MSILIPNMTIPKDCDECPFRWPHLAHCSITGKSTSHYPTGKEIKGKPNYCPLVDIVRCKECKFSARYVDDGHIECRLYSHPLRHDYHEMKPDDFCSYGERREP